MRRNGAALLVLLSVWTAVAQGPAAFAGGGRNAHVSLTGTMRGRTFKVTVAGLQPNFDIVDRVVIGVNMRATGLPSFRLIFDTYLEGYQSNTQPRLPDLVHPFKTLHRTLGGFFAGKSIILSRSGNVLFAGSFLGEALIRTKCLFVRPGAKAPKICRTQSQHFVAWLSGWGPARGSSLYLRGTFLGDERLRITRGSVRITGRLTAAGRNLLGPVSRPNIKRLEHRFALRGRAFQRSLGRLASKAVPMSAPYSSALHRSIRYLLHFKR